MNWYFNDSKGVQGPLSESQLRTILANGFESTATVRQGESSWVTAVSAKAKFAQLEKEGIYLRSDDKIYGPYVHRRAVEIRQQAPDRFDSYRFGPQGKWLPIGDLNAIESKASTPNYDPLEEIGIAVRQRYRALRGRVSNRLLIAAIVVPILLAIAYLGFLRPLTPEQRLAKELASVRQVIKDDLIEKKEKIAIITDMTMNQAAYEISRMRMKMEDARARSQQQELEQNLREEFEAVSIKLEGELHILEEKEKARKDAEQKRIDLKQKQEQVRVQAEQSQADLRKACERLFSKIEIRPDSSVRIADLISEQGGTLELRGVNFELIAQCLKEQDWIRLVNTLLERSYKELPEFGVLEDSAKTLASYDFQILLKSTDSDLNDQIENPASKLKLVTLWVTPSSDNQTFVLSRNTTWVRHPDGIGFTQKWNPNQGNSVVTLVAEDELKIKEKELADTYAHRVTYFKNKANLGEIPTDLLDPFYSGLRSEFIEKMTGWALVQDRDQDNSGSDLSNMKPKESNSGNDADSKGEVLKSLNGSKTGDSLRIKSIDLPLKWISPGKFEMGSPKNEVGRGKNETQVKVSLTKGFWISQAETTQSQWKLVMGTEPWQPKVQKAGPRFPATCVSWKDAKEFTRRLTNIARKDKVIPRTWEFSLPTEAQWELACRSGSDTRFSFGNDEGDLATYAWYSGNASDSSEFFAHEAARKKPNKYGLFDMHGNVFEWCLDSYTEQLTAGADPLRFLANTTRSYRGGSWKRSSLTCRSAYRVAADADFWEIDLGFRVVLREVFTESIGAQVTNVNSSPLSVHLPSMPNEGYYVGANNNETDRKKEGANLVFSGDVAIYVTGEINSVYEFAVMWIRNKNHELEKRGYLVYQRPVHPFDVLVIFDCDGKTFKARYLYESKDREAIVFDSPALAKGKTGTIAGSWKNNKVLVGNINRKLAPTELLGKWRELLEQHAPNSLGK